MHSTSQHLVTTAQLASAGLTAADIRSSVNLGRLTRIRRGVYRSGEMLEPAAEHLRLLHGTALAVDTGSVFSHESAGVVHGLPVPRDSLRRANMIRRSEGHGKSTHCLRVRKMVLADDDVETVAGVQVTNLARTAADLARTQPFEWGVAACDAALRLGLDRNLLWESVTRHKRLRGGPRARAVVAFADARSESPAESISRAQFALQGIPTPELQFEVINEHGVVVARTDFAWPELGLVGEVDGRSKYGTLLAPGHTPEMAIMNEKRREEEIRLAGYWLVRWDWALCLQGAELAQRIWRAAEAQRRAARH